MEDLEQKTTEELAELGKIVLKMGPRDAHQQDSRGWNRFYDTAIRKWTDASST